MTTIAQLTDLHLIDDEGERTLSERLREAFVAVGRWSNARDRRERARKALACAGQADHVVITGDLTETGTRAQFEVVAEVLHESGLDPRRVTLVPGNHDMYDGRHGFAEALAGPLAAFAPTSQEGTVTLLDGAAIMPVCTAFPQSVTRSRGAIATTTLHQLAHFARECWLGPRALVVAQHHPPYRHPVPGMQWVDGLINHRHQRALLEYYPRAHVLHGHLHQHRDVALLPFSDTQVFGARDVVSADDDPVRLYDIRDGVVVARAREMPSAIRKMPMARTWQAALPPA